MMSKTLNKVRCFLYDHDWSYWREPIESKHCLEERWLDRKCLRCGKIEERDIV